jgi:hypothetical protein
MTPPSTDPVEETTTLSPAVIAPVTAPSDGDSLGNNVGPDLGIGSDGQAAVGKFDGSLNTAVNRHIL